MTVCFWPCLHTREERKQDNNLVCFGFVDLCYNLVYPDWRLETSVVVRCLCGGTKITIPAPNDAGDSFLGSSRFWRVLELRLFWGLDLRLFKNGALSFGCWLSLDICLILLHRNLLVFSWFVYIVSCCCFDKTYMKISIKFAHFNVHIH